MMFKFNDFDHSHRIVSAKQNNLDLVSKSRAYDLLVEADLADQGIWCKLHGWWWWLLRIWIWPKLWLLLWLLFVVSSSVLLCSTWRLLLRFPGLSLIILLPLPVVVVAVVRGVRWAPPPAGPSIPISTAIASLLMLICIMLWSLPLLLMLLWLIGVVNMRPTPTPPVADPSNLLSRLINKITRAKGMIIGSRRGVEVVPVLLHEGMPKTTAIQS